MNGVVEALREISRTFEPDAWLQPLQGQAVRRAVRTAVSQDVSADAFRANYAEVPLREYLAALADARAALQDARLRRDVERPVDQFIQELGTRATAIARRDDDQFSKTVAQLDGLPSEGLELLGWQVLNDEATDQLPEHRVVNDRQAVDVIRNVLDLYGLSPWTVISADGMAARMSVNGPLRRVRVRVGAVFSPVEIRRLVVHEVGGHVLRWVNSESQPLPVAGIQLGRSIPTEEGLALCLEESFGLSDAPTRRIYAARVIGVVLSQSLGVVDLVRRLARYIGTDSAVDIALRAKRGLTDLNAPGGMTKDWSYLGGIEQMRSLGESDPEGLRLLQGVKWSVEHLELIKQLHADNLLNNPEVLPDERLLDVRIPD